MYKVLYRGGTDPFTSVYPAIDPYGRPYNAICWWATYLNHLQGASFYTITNINCLTSIRVPFFKASKKIHVALPAEVIVEVKRDPCA